MAVAASAFGAADAHVADCERGPVMIGSGSPNWRQQSLDAGPLGVRPRPLLQMDRVGRSSTYATKMPVIVEGHGTVTLSVPPRLARRVFLYYGSHEGPDGKRSTSMVGYPGDSTIEFQPCADKPRTVWPGGIRVKGRAPVRLLVRVAGSGEPIPLRLGRPTPYRPPMR